MSLKQDAKRKSEGVGMNTDSFCIIHVGVIIFPRVTKPIYPEYASEEEKKYITWQTAHNDIDMLRRRGYHGQKFKVYPKLVNINKGKYRTVEKLWNNKFNQWVPMSRKTSDCEVRKKKVPLKPKWSYHIISLKRL